MQVSELTTSPRVISAAWAVWAWFTAVAYWHTTPSQLDPVTRIMPGNWVLIAWAFSATLLTIGAVLPSRKASQGARIIGLSLTAGLLISWGMAYLWEALTNGNRMWVSAKNYLFMAIIAMGTAQLVGRSTNPGRIPHVKGR